VRERQRTRDREHIVGTSIKRYEEQESEHKRVRERESERARESKRVRKREGKLIVSHLWTRGKERESENPSSAVGGHETTESERVREGEWELERDRTYCQRRSQNDDHRRFVTREEMVVDGSCQTYHLAGGSRVISKTRTHTAEKKRTREGSCLLDSASK